VHEQVAGRDRDEPVRVVRVRDEDDADGARVGGGCGLGGHAESIAPARARRSGRARERGRALDALLALLALALGAAIGLGVVARLAGSAERAAAVEEARGEAAGGGGVGGAGARARAGTGAGTGARRPRGRRDGAGGASDRARGLEDGTARIVFEEALAAMTATARPWGADRGAGRVFGHVRTRTGAPVAGIRIEAMHMMEPGPAPSDEEALRIGLAGRPDALGLDDPVTTLETALREAARALVRQARIAPVAVSGPDGAYEIAGLPPGRHELTVHAPQHSVHPRRFEGATPLDPNWVFSLGAGAPPEVRVDFLAERRMRVRFEFEVPPDVTPVSYSVDVRGQRSWSLDFEDGESDPIEVPAGVHVVDASVRARVATGTAGILRLETSEVFAVEEGGEPPPVRLRFARPRRALVHVVSDDPETEDWRRVRLYVRPEGHGGGRFARLEDGTRGLGYGPNGAEGALPELPPGRYTIEARRELEPPEPPGPRERFEVAEDADVEVTTRLPPSDRTVRIRVVVEGLEDGNRSAAVEIRRRTPDGDASLASDTLTGEEGGAPEITFALRPVDALGPGGAPAQLIASARTGRDMATEGPVPPGREALVVLRAPARAALALTVTDAPGAAPPIELRAELGAPGGWTAGRSALVMDGAEEGRYGCSLGPVGAGTYLVRVFAPSDDHGDQELASARVTLAPGENALTITLPRRSTCAIASARAGRIRVYAADGSTHGSGVLERHVETGGVALLPMLAHGLHVAEWEGARDPFGGTDAPPERAAMVFRVPAEADPIPFVDAPLEALAPCILSRCAPLEAAGLARGDVLVAIDGAPPRDPWAPLAPLLDAPPRSPDEASITVRRDGATRTVALPLAPLRARRDDRAFGPVPAE